MEEEDLHQELITTKHLCKFCNKSFPCGRSLGGHMRSHVITSASESADNNEKEKLNNNSISTTKPSSSSHETGTTNNNNNNNTGYGLRENPKKTWRIADNSTVGEDTLFLIPDKLCKECGRGFPSWKALFGHMKRHSSEKSARVSDQDSWTNNNSSSSSMMKLVMDSQSDNESTAPSKRRRSKRRTRRYMVASTTTTTAATTSTSLSEVEQEQEEVAMSLMMLSRDVGNWSGLHSVAESTGNEIGHCFEVRSCSSVRTNLVSRFDSKKNHIHTLYESEVEISVSKGESSELFVNGSKFIKNEAALDDSEAEIEKSRVNGTEPGLSKIATSNKNSSIKTKLLDSELKSNSLKNSVKRPSEGEFMRKNSYSHKRGKFECTTCNRIFHSYQALGGHRASHKKIKGCFASRNDHQSSDENSIETETETELSPDENSKQKKKQKNNNSVVESENLVEDEFVGAGADSGFDNNDAGTTSTITTPSKSKVYECPICFKVFASGQALGGHKRSHMSGGIGSSPEIRNCKKFLIQESSVPEIRDFLDLNIPPAVAATTTTEEESNRSWWILQGNNHKQEALVGLNV